MMTSDPTDKIFESSDSEPRLNSGSKPAFQLLPNKKDLNIHNTCKIALTNAIAYDGIKTGQCRLLTVQAD